MKVGDQAPSFELPDEQGRPRTLQEFLDQGPVALFFYPAAMTPGCTAESCHFRDLQREFTEAGASILGISADAVSRQAQFADKYSLGYPLLSDVSGEVRSAYGVKRGFSLMPTKRVTFVISPAGEILEIISSEVKMSVHADRALSAVRAGWPPPA